jgi:hypothetical protein
LANHFAAGTYLRERHAKAGSIIVGRIHKRDHLNIISKGRVVVMTEGQAPETYTAPAVFKAEAGSQKIIYVEQDTVWLAVFATDETDPDKMEELLTVAEHSDLEGHK